MKYPLGIQSFEKLRTEGFSYVDKTAFVYRLDLLPIIYQSWHLTIKEYDARFGNYRLGFPNI